MVLPSRTAVVPDAAAQAGEAQALRLPRGGFELEGVMVGRQEGVVLQE
jgi:hypothetical protein